MVSTYQKRREIIATELDRFPYISYVKPDGAFYFLWTFEIQLDFLQMEI